MFNNNAQTVGLGVSFGALEWIRTTDLRLRRATLYPAELRAQMRASMLARPQAMQDRPAQLTIDWGPDWLDDGALVLAALSWTPWIGMPDSSGKSRAR